MDYTIDVMDDRQYILVKVKGKISRNESMKLIVDVYDQGEEAKIDRYLMDMRETDHDWSYVDDYEFLHQDIDQQPRFNRSARTALLVAPEDTSYDFIVTASKNAGLNVQLFHNREQAVTFLTTDKGKLLLDSAKF